MQIDIPVELRLRFDFRGRLPALSHVDILNVLSHGFINIEKNFPSHIIVLLLGLGGVLRDLGDLRRLNRPNGPRPHLEPDLKLHKGRVLGCILHVGLILLLAVHVQVRFELGQVAEEFEHGHRLTQCIFGNGKLILNELHAQIENVLVLPQVHHIHTVLLLCLLDLNAALLEAILVDQKDHGGDLGGYSCVREVADRFQGVCSPLRLFFGFEDSIFGAN